MSELHKFLFEGLPVRGMLVRLTDGWREVLTRRESTGPFPAPVRRPADSTERTADSIRSAASVWLREKRSIMAADRIVAKGLAMPFPAMSGALPWLGS